MNAPDQVKQYDRTTQTVGNIVHLEHFNCLINDQRLATLFYVVALGGTRDPYIFMGLENMWVNFGRTQVHLPSRGPAPKPEVLRGTVGFVVPDLEALKKNLEFAGKEMKRVVPEKETRFSWRDMGDTVEATCPWGNRIRCHAPSPEFPRTELGLVYVDYRTQERIPKRSAHWYRELIAEHARLAGNSAAGT